jgi:hypothetical protein
MSRNLTSKIEKLLRQELSTEPLCIVVRNHSLRNQSSCIPLHLLLGCCVPCAERLLLDMSSLQGGLCLSSYCFCLRPNTVPLQFVHSNKWQCPQRS